MEVAVSVFRILSSSRFTPRRKLLLPALGVIALDHAHTAQRFGQPAGDLGVDLAALAKDWTDGPECFASRESEHDQESKRQHRHGSTDVEEPHQCQGGGEQSAAQLDQPGADQIAHTFDVGHDARDESAGLVGVVIGNRQPSDVRLHLAAKFSDGPLPGL